MTRDMAESLAIPAALATPAPGSSTATPLDTKRQRSATDIKALLGDSFNYLVSKLFKFTHTYDKINTLLEKDVRAMVKEVNINTEAIMLHMLATIAGSLHSLL